MRNKPLLGMLKACKKRSPVKATPLSQPRKQTTGEAVREAMRWGKVSQGDAMGMG